MTQEKKSKNALIELYRFIFALNVVKGHGLFPYQGRFFTPARISVEFFFVLSGFLLLGSIDKFVDKPLREGLVAFLWRKIRALLVPLAIGVAFNYAEKIISSDPITLHSVFSWGYLWYVQDMLLVFTAIFLLRKYVKDEKKFTWIIAVIFLLSTALNITEFFYSWGLFRAFSSIPLGVLASYLPRANLKKSRKIWVFLAPVQAATFAVLFFGLTNVERYGALIERINALALYPALIYLSFQVTFENKAIEYLGGLSFGLYAFQCVADFFRTLGIANVWILFAIVLVPTLVDDLRKRISNKKRKRAS